DQLGHLAKCGEAPLPLGFAPDKENGKPGPAGRWLPHAMRPRWMAGIGARAGQPLLRRSDGATNAFAYRLKTELEGDIRERQVTDPEPEARGIAFATRVTSIRRAAPTAARDAADERLAVRSGSEGPMGGASEPVLFMRNYRRAAWARADFERCQRSSDATIMVGRFTAVDARMGTFVNDIAKALLIPNTACTPAAWPPLATDPYLDLARAARGHAQNQMQDVAPALRSRQLAPPTAESLVASARPWGILARALIIEDPSPVATGTLDGGTGFADQAQNLRCRAARLKDVSRKAKDKVAEVAIYVGADVAPQELCPLAPPAMAVFAAMAESRATQGVGKINRVALEVKAPLANDLCLDLALAVGGYAENRKMQDAVSAPTRTIILEDPIPVVKGMQVEGLAPADQAQHPRSRAPRLKEEPNKAKDKAAVVAINKEVVGKINRIDVEEWANERVGNTPVKLCRPENCDNDGQVKIALSVAYQEREEICVDSF
ncbi:unnamed protein product, partial [Prorocentrum cordatum]